MRRIRCLAPYVALLVLSFLSFAVAGTGPGAIQQAIHQAFNGRVNVTTHTTGQALTWDGTAWIASTVAAGGGDPTGVGDWTGPASANKVGRLSGDGSGNVYGPVGAGFSILGVAGQGGTIAADDGNGGAIEVRVDGTVVATGVLVGTTLRGPTSSPLKVGGGLSSSAGTAGGDLQFQVAMIGSGTSASTPWAIEASSGGHLKPGGNATFDLGSSTNNVRALYASGISAAGAPFGDGQIRCGTGTGMVLAQNGYLSLGSAAQVGWSAGDPSGVPMDVGLSRSAAGVITVTNGSTGSGRLSLATSVYDLAGSGSPEGAVTAAVGSVYRRTNGGASTALYVKESGSGNTGWVAYGAPTASFGTGQVYRLPIEYLSATTVRLGQGNARSALDDADISVTNAYGITLDVTTTGDTGLNTLTSARTYTTTSGLATATASATVWGDFSARTPAGTVTTVGTALTGTSSRFLLELSPGDVVQIGTKGAARISSVTSDTAAVLVAALPDGDATGVTSSSWYVYENLTIKIASQATRRINTIDNAGTAIVLSGNASVTLGGQQGVWGAEHESCWLAVFTGTVSGSGSGFLSTQRTIPYTMTGLTAYRRIGWIYNNASGDIQSFRSTGSGLTRTVSWEMDNTLSALSNGGSTTWTDVVCSTFAPPTASRITFFAQLSGGTADVLSVRPRGVSAGTGVSPLGLFRSITVAVGSPIDCPCDTAQVIQVRISAGTTGGFLDVAGYTDEL